AAEEPPAKPFSEQLASVQDALDGLALPVSLVLADLTIDRLTLETRAGPSDAAGDVTVYTVVVSGSADWPRDGAAARSLDLIIAGENGEGDAIIALAYAPATGDFDLATRVDVPDPQVMANLTGLPYALRLTIDGNGPLANWQGRVTGGLDQMAQISAPITLGVVGDALAVNTAVSINLEDQAPAPLVSLTEGAIDLSIESQVTDTELTLSKFDIRTGPLSAQLTGVVNHRDLLTSLVTMQATMAATTDGYGMVPGLTLSGAALDLVMAPDSQDPAFALTSTITGLGFGEYQVERVQAAFDLPDVQPLLTDQLQPFEWQIDMAGIATDNPALAEAMAEVGPAQSLSGDGRVAPDFSRYSLSLAPFSILGGEIMADVAADRDGLDQSHMAITALPLPKILALAGMVGDQALITAGVLDASIELMQLGGVLAASGQVQLSQMAYRDPRAMALLGPAPMMTIETAAEASVPEITRKEAGTQESASQDITVLARPVTVTISGDQLRADATLSGLGTPKQDADYQLQITEAATLHEVLSGPLTLMGQLTRDGDQMAITAGLEPLQLVDRPLDATRFDARIDTAKQQASGIRLTTAWATIPIVLTTDTLRWASGIAAETIRLAVADDEALLLQAEGGITTDNRLDVRVSGGLQNTDFVQKIAPDSSVSAATRLVGTITGTTTAPRVEMALTDMEVAQATQRLDRAQLTLATTPTADGALAIALTGEGRHRQPGASRSVAMALDAITAPSARVTITNLAADYGNLPVRLDGNSVLDRSATGMTLSPTELLIADQALRLEGRYGPGRVAGRVAADTWSLDTLAAALDLPAIKGVFDLQLDLNASPQAVDMESVFSLSGLSMEASLDAGLPVYDMTGSARWNGRNLTLDVTGRDTADQAPMTINMTLPMRAVRDQTAALTGVLVPDDGRLDGRVAGTVDMALVNQVVEAAGHRLGGQVVVDLALAGTVANPGLSGAITTQQVSYRNLLHGVAFDEIDIRMAGSLDGLVVDRMRLVAVNGGTIQGTGGITFGENAPLDMTVRFNNAQLVQSDLADVILDGDLALAGRMREHLLSGGLTITETEIRIPKRLPQTVATLEVEEEIDATTPAEDEAPAAPMVTNLDITIDAPDRIFVRGLGLDLTMGGGIRVQGTAAEPDITGGFDLVQGRLDVAGQTWNFDRGGLEFSAFDGQPVLDIAASRAAGEITAIIVVEGPVSGPTISLTSEPPMAQGEIASRILFGEGSAGLTAVQAVQATELLATLQGNSGRGVLGTARETLGIDQLSVDQTEGGASVSAGTFVSDGVFIGVNQGVGDVGSEVEIEVDITDTIKFEGTTGNRNNSSVGLSIEWDY
ncbi:MAG: translocation/assembly module TamB domain-containing protein, partial [Pseudomonadota bacterium]